MDVDHHQPAALRAVAIEPVEGVLHDLAVFVDQPFVKLPEKSVKDIITEKIAKIGENIQIRRFVRYQLGS